jgi:hypothetical protein
MGNRLLSDHPQHERLSAPVSAEDAVALAQLAEIVKAMSAAKAPKQKAGSGT